MDRPVGLKRAGLAVAAAAWLAWAGYAVVLFRNASHAVGGSDSSGYVNAARLLGSGRVSTPILPADLAGVPASFDHVFLPLAFVPGPEPRTMTPFYSVGFPLHVAGLSAAIGWTEGPFLASPLLALGCVLLIFLTGRELGLPVGYALAGAALLGLCAVFLFQALQPMSDVAATFWSLAAVWGGLRARRRPGWAVVGGLAFGIAILVRPTNVLLLPALLCALPLRVRTLALFAAGGIPPAAVFGLYNNAAYGHPLRTGWVATSLLDGFAWNHFPARFLDYSGWISKMLTPLVPLGWLAVSGDRSVKRRDRALLLSWFGAFLVFYCFYAVYGTWWYTRFLIPGIPALILAFLMVVRDLAARWRLRPGLVAFLILAVSGWAILQTQRLEVVGLAEGQEIIPRTCSWAAARMPQKAAVVSMEMSGAVRYYTARQPVRWDRTTPETFPQLRALLESAGYRWYALLIAHEVKLAEARVPGSWTFVGETGPISLWRLEPAAVPASR